MMYAFNGENKPVAPIEVVDSFIGREEMIDLTPFQKWICKIFKIRPAKSYKCSGQIWVIDNRLCVNDIIMTEDDSRFLVTASESDLRYVVQGLGLFENPVEIKKGSFIVIAAKTFIES